MFSSGSRRTGKSTAESALKEGEGPDDLKEYFRLAGQGLYLESQDVQPDPAFQREFEASRNKVRHYFQR